MLCCLHCAVANLRVSPSVLKPLQGHVYVGVPPLYKLEVGRKAQVGFVGVVCSKHAHSCRAI